MDTYKFRRGGFTGVWEKDIFTDEKKGDVSVLTHYVSCLLKHTNTILPLGPLPCKPRETRADLQF